MKRNRIIIVFAIVAILLLIPLIAMQFDSGVDWDLVDFITMGVLLTVTGLSVEFASRKIHSFGFKLFVCGAILLAFFLIWAELAVGIFGSPFAGS
jgi:hypothetical protein